MKIVRRKIKNCPALRCNPIIKYEINENIIDGRTRIGRISQRSLAKKNVEIR